MKLSLKKDIDALRQTACNRIDVAAGERRRAFITVVPGQELVYAEKQREAEAFMKRPATVIMQETPAVKAEYPHIAAEAAMNKITMYDQAVEFINQAKNWREASALIEERRLSLKKLIMQAKTPAEIAAITF